MKKMQLVVLSLVPLMALFSGSLQAQPIDQARLHPAIPLLDETGQHVLDSGKPYSSRMSCGVAGCHDYEAITHAFHIETGRDEADDNFGALRNLPPLVSPGYFGGYNCMGRNNPERLAKKVNNSADDFADLGSAGWIQRCASCHSGGGWMEKDRHGRRYDQVDPATVPTFDGDYYNRGTDENNQPVSKDIVSRWDWQKSGVVENDCLICHADFNALQAFGPQPVLTSRGRVVQNPDPLSLFKYVRRDELIRGGAFFRYANTAILGYINLNLTTDPAADQAVLNGFLRDTEQNLLLDDQGLPVPDWNRAAFSADGKVEIPMLRFPGNDNCMMCHRTSNSRRGFYGFGEGAEAVYDEDGMLEEDYQDDVHKGRLWMEANGEERSIENCNACHARNYFRPASANVDLDASHNFLKGNSDMDVRNDLDYAPGARSCEYCHDEAENPAIPSGQADMLSAHLERWKNSGHLAGYPRDALQRITRTHLDIVSCQACHITGKKSRGRPLDPLYRYRQSEDGKLRIVPYNPRARYFWRDRNSGRILNKTERDSVFEIRDDDAGNKYGVIVDPVTGAELGTVTVRLSHGSWRFGDPESYQAFVALKGAYDSLLAGKGVDNPDTVLVWTEINAYLMSHNTRPAVSSLQCEDCHSRKQDGSFSALLATDGLLGEANRREITTLVDPRLVEEGLVVFDQPYMQVDAAGVVSENVADILYATSLDPSMTGLRSATARAASGALQRMPAADGVRAAGIDDAGLATLFASGEVYFYRPNYGHEDLRDIALMPEANGQTELVFPTYRVQVALADAQIVARAASGSGELKSAVYALELRNNSGARVQHFSDRILVKLPYRGNADNAEAVRVLYSADGNDWSSVSADDIVRVSPRSDRPGAEAEGYVAFWTDHFSYYTVADVTAAAVPTSDTGTAPATDSGGGGGATGPGLLLLILCAGLLARRQGRR